MITSFCTQDSGNTAVNILKSSGPLLFKVPGAIKAIHNIVTYSHDFKDKLITNLQEVWKNRPATSATTKEKRDKILTENLSSVDHLLEEIVDAITNEFIKSLSETIKQETEKRANSILGEKMKKAVSNAIKKALSKDE